MCENPKELLKEIDFEFVLDASDVCQTSREWTSSEQLDLQTKPCMYRYPDTSVNNQNTHTFETFKADLNI